MTERKQQPEIKPGTRVGRYTVLHLVGEGGMGVVFAAYDPQLDRKIALKLLRREPSWGTSARRETDRLLREAQSMARLSHPNVATVHDVGTHGERVFIAMEYVEGSDLKRWLESNPSRREILDVFIRAGRGLAAAHAAGLMHRDFKAENVLLGRDGRVRVVDFGLARQFSSSLTGEVTAAQPVLDPGTLDQEHSRITSDGILVGTPRYMAPERLRGGVGDARSDQFAFCLSLYEALYGEPPFEKRPVPHIIIEGLGEVLPAPEGTDVAAWIRQVLIRGLKADPSDRFSSMDALLEALSQDPAVRRRRIANRAGAAALAVVMAAGAVLLVRQQRTQCRTVGDAVTKVWSDQVRDRLRRAFVATGSPVARSAWHRTDEALGRYAGAWAAMRSQACRATHVTGEQSEALLDLRMQCLDRRLEELTALLAVFRDPDPNVVRGAPKAALSLPPLDNCADAAVLTAPVKPPPDEATTRKVGRIQLRLASARALETTGRLEQALEIAATARAAAAKIGYAPLTAEATVRLGSIEERLGRTEEAGTDLFAALVKSLAGNDQGLAVQALTNLLWVDGNDLGRFGAADRWAQLAEATLERLGRPAPLLLEYLNNLGSVQLLEGHADEAMRTHREALALARRLDGDDSYRTARSLVNIGNIQIARCRFADALDSYRRAQPIIEARLGQHPAAAMAWSNIGASQLELGWNTEARAAFQKSLALRTAIFGEGTFWPAVSELNLAFTDLEDHRFADALERSERVQAAFKAALPPDHPYYFYLIAVRGRAELGLGRKRSAAQLLDTAVQLSEKGGGILPYEIAQARFGLAEALWPSHPTRSLALARNALEAVQSITAEQIPFARRVQTWLADRGHSS